MNCSYTKSLRLRTRGQFQRIAHLAVRYVGNWILIEARPNRNGVTRLGITVSRRYGKAHQRNRLKRMVREAFRLSRHSLKTSYDINVKPRSSAHAAKMQNVLEDLVRLFGTHSHVETVSIR